jgi:ABC-type Zn2+ transport system substrate-binding protein/surface adhesin
VAILFIRGKNKDMRFLTVLGIIALIAGVAYFFVFRDLGKSSVNEPVEQIEATEEHQHDHNHEGHDHEGHSHGEMDHDPMQQEQENKPYYQGEIINIEHGGSYTYLEILENTDMSFWIVVERVEAKKGDFVMFQEQLVAQDFYSEALDKTFDEVMFATNLRYKVEE